MGFGLLDPQQAMEKVYDYFVSKEWWIIVESNNNDISNKLQSIESEYFSNEKNQFFETILLPRLGVIYLLKKSCISKEQLAKNMGTPIPQGNQDVFFPKFEDNLGAYWNRIRVF